MRPNPGLVQTVIALPAGLRQWKKVWLVTVHESELPDPLDFRTLTVAREPVVIVRGSDGKIRAFLNVCPHRGNLILRQPSGSLTVAEPSGNAISSNGPAIQRAGRSM